LLRKYKPGYQLLKAQMSSGLSLFVLHSLSHHTRV
jgi:hypothetical protein